MAKSTTKKRIQNKLSKPSFGRSVSYFLSNIESIADSYPLVISTLKDKEKKTQELVDRFKKEKKLITRQEGTKKITGVPGQYVEAFRLLLKNSYHAHLAIHTVPKSLFVSLVSHFDVFLREVLKLIYYTKPEIFNSIEKQFSFAEIQKFKKLTEAKEWIVDQSIDNLLRESHPSNFKWLERNLGIDFKNDEELWKKFIEITERRNLFVHTDGVITQQYLNVCKEHRVILGAEFSLGKRLPLSEEYFYHSLNTIIELGIKLTQLTWRKLLPNELESADKNLSDISYNLLCNKKYEMVKAILNVIEEKKFKCFNESYRLMLVINRALAIKFSGDEKQVQKILSSYDWSATENNFRLASAILLDNHREAINIMRLIGKDKGMQQAYKEWPLFTVFRKKEIFLKVYKSIFKEQFSVEENNKTH